MLGTEGKIYFKGLDVHRVYHKRKVVYGVPDLREIIYITDHLDMQNITDSINRISLYKSDVYKVSDVLETTEFIDTIKIILKEV